MTIHDQLCTAVDAAFDEEVAFLRELVRVPTDTPPGDNAPHAERTALLLEAMGHAVERHPVPEAQVQAAGLESITNLVVRQRFGSGGPTIALNAHGDVVPPGAGWTQPPYEGRIVDGRMVGRGVAVSKSDFATYTFALRALQSVAMQSTGLALRGAVELHFTYDEEFGGELGPGWLLARGISKPHLALAAGFSYAIVTAHNGCLQLEVTVHGRAAHAAMPETGVDALAAAIGIIEALYAERTRYATCRSHVAGIGTPTINVGRIEGGTNTNVVPDRVSFRLDRRMIPEEDPAAVEAALRELIAGAARTWPDARVEVRRLLLARALAPLPGHKVLVLALQRHATRLVAPQVPATGTPLYTDARLYCEAGVPIVLYGAGPRKATQVVACALADLLSSSSPIR
jgi:acetylornithine deacetylase/succinyl-diaminopimelate desuccinylase-like protein